MLMYDCSNRAIGYQGPDYCESSRFDPAAGLPMSREAFHLRQCTDAAGRMPGPRTHECMPDLYSCSHLQVHEKRPAPW